MSLRQNRFSILFIILLFSITGCAQDQASYLGGWEGKIVDAKAFEFAIALEVEDSTKAKIQFNGQSSRTEIPLRLNSNKLFEGNFKDQLFIDIDLNSGDPIVFFQVGHHLCAVDLKENGSNKWTGIWNLLLTEDNPSTFLMALDRNADESVYASIFFEEPTLHYMFAEQFSLVDDKISFRDLRSKILFDGTIGDDRIEMKVQFLNEVLDVNLSPRPVREWRLGEADSKHQSSESSVNDDRFDGLVRDVKSDLLERTHAVVISQNDRLIFEHYFDGFTKDVIHDTRSLAKSFASAALGIVIQEGFITNEFETIKPFYNQTYPNMDWSNGKDDVNLFHLMTMSSGLDAIDFGLNRNSYANENTYRSREDWTKHILDAPMVYQPGSQGNYGSGSPHLLGPIISSRIDERLEFYLHKKLFAPLDIRNYRIQTTNVDEPYFGGGWYFRPTDLIKFGQLYLNGGMYNGHQIIAQEWIRKSMQRHVVLNNTNDKNPYGYLFWHKTYNINGRYLNSIEARGAGGQYLFMVPVLNLVAVITSGNYANNKAFQPERIFSDYILSVIAN